MKIYLSYRERVAGIFILLTFLLVVAFVVGAAVQNRWFASTVIYKTYVVRGDGLRTGLPVLLSGIDVGEIQELTIMEDNRIQVEMAILKKHSRRIQNGTKASIRRVLGIGEKRIHLVAPIKKGEALPPGASIPADEPLDLLDAIATVDLNRYMNTMDRAVGSMEILLSKLEENNRMERMVEAFDQLGPTMVKVNELLGEINEPFAELIKDPSLRRTFQGADKVFNYPHTRKALRAMSTSFEPKRIAGLMERTDSMIGKFDKMLDEGGHLEGAIEGADRLMNDGRMDRMLTSMERLTDAEKLEKLIDNMSILAKQMARIGPEIPTMSREMIKTMRELSIVLKALQKTWLLDDEADEVIKEMRKKKKKKKSD